MFKKLSKTIVRSKINIVFTAHKISVSAEVCAMRSTSIISIVALLLLYLFLDQF